MAHKDADWQGTRRRPDAPVPIWIKLAYVLPPGPRPGGLDGVPLPPGPRGRYRHHQNRPWRPAGLAPNHHRRLVGTRHLRTHQPLTEARSVGDPARPSPGRQATSGQSSLTMKSQAPSSPSICAFSSDCAGRVIHPVTPQSSRTSIWRRRRAE